MDDLIASAWHAEETLLRSGVRHDADRLQELLAPDFVEIGQSGRRWSRDEIVASLLSDTEPVPDAELAEREATYIAPDTVLLSYRLTFGPRISRRSSLWRRQDGSVTCIFHQGTPIPATDD